MDHLEQFIRNHAGLFDDQEPAPGHFERFEQRLAKQEEQSFRPSPMRFWMRIAAGIVILMTAGLAIFELATHDFSNRTALQQASLGLPDELAEVLDIYQQRSDQQIIELTKLAQSCPQGSRLMQLTQKEVEQLDRNMNDLVSALRESPNDPRVQNALIQTCKAKETLLSDKIHQEKIKQCN